MLKGLVRKSSAPASMMRDNSSPLAAPENITTLRCGDRRPLAQPAEDLLAAVTRQVHVEQNEVVGRLGGQVDGVRPGPGLVAGEPLRRQRRRGTGGGCRAGRPRSGRGPGTGSAVDLRLVGAATVGVPRAVGWGIHVLAACAV